MKKGEVREDSAIYGIIVGFPFADASFMNGFEAGMIWRELWLGTEERDVLVNKANVDGLIRPAEKRGYSVLKTDCTDPDLVWLRMVLVEDKGDPGTFFIGDISRVGHREPPTPIEDAGRTPAAPERASDVTLSTAEDVARALQGPGRYLLRDDVTVKYEDGEQEELVYMVMEQLRGKNVRIAWVDDAAAESFIARNGVEAIDEEA